MKNRKNYVMTKSNLPLRKADCWPFCCNASATKCSSWPGVPHIGGRCKLPCGLASPAVGRTQGTNARRTIPPSPCENRSAPHLNLSP